MIALWLTLAIVATGTIRAFILLRRDLARERVAKERHGCTCHLARQRRAQRPVRHAAR